MKLVIDTNAYSGLNRGQNKPRQFITKDNTLYVPFVVIAELKAGFLLGNKLAINEELLADFLDQPNVTTLHSTYETTQIFADLFYALRKIGKPIGSNDIWIAALCVEHDLPLLTLDTDFRYINGLKLL